MKASAAEARRWLRQAESDLTFADLGATRGFAAQACFVAQQAAEKALKAVHYHAGARFVPGHSLVELLGGLLERHPTLDGLGESARVLDQYYIPTRYPNGLPGGIPADVYTPAQAVDAVARARAAIEAAREIVAGS